mmetsp:Transcript_36777/g.56319  ORF Transcript_36777/g.56319 Transcript_36777/m.56319 type:complete len:132 (-) Transcript_36777:37-432(-)
MVIPLAPFLVAAVYKVRWLLLPKDSEESLKLLVRGTAISFYYAFILGCIIGAVTLIYFVGLLVQKGRSYAGLGFPFFVLTFAIYAVAALVLRVPHLAAKKLLREAALREEQGKSAATLSSVLPMRVENSLE